MEVSLKFSAHMIPLRTHHKQQNTGVSFVAQIQSTNRVRWTREQTLATGIVVDLLCVKLTVEPLLVELQVGA